MPDTTARSAALRQMLNARRHEIADDVHRRIREGRAGVLNEVRDDIEHSDADIQGDVDFALLQMRAEMRTGIDAALVRLDAGTYGWCAECSDEIADRRLRALPFAVRCQACEERREQEQGRRRQHAQGRAGFSLFPEMVNS